MIDPRSAAATSEYQGTMFYSCLAAKKTATFVTRLHLSRQQLEKQGRGPDAV
jgi:hypothetical protein